MAVLAVVTASAACASAASSTRELPVGLTSIGALLDGCEPDTSSDGTQRMRCGGDVVLSLRERSAGSAEPRYRAEAYGMAQNAGARLVWDQIVVATEGPSGLLDRARALAPGSDDAKGTLVAASRSVGGHAVQDVWCSSDDDAGFSRCKNLLGAVLGNSNDDVHSETAAAAAARLPPPSAAPARTSGPTNVFGHALSLPTSCLVSTLPDGAQAVCEGGKDGTVSWHRFDEMADATQAVRAAFDALGSNDDGSGFSCTLMGEPAQCEAHERALAAIAYMNGKPVAAICSGVGDPVHNGICRALITSASAPKSQ
ncbi:MAG TPA: hypothetical protein VGO62_08975 [Myxococcota bacterium]